MYSSISKHLVLPLADKILGTRIKSTFTHLQKTQWLSTEEIEKYQVHKLKKLVNFSYNNIPFYNKFMKDAKIYPNDIKSLKDLSKFPVIDKSTINSNPQDFVNKSLSRINHLPWATGGTTGHPLKFNISLNAKSFHVAAKLRSQKWAGYNYGDKKLTIGGTSLIPDQKISFSNKMRMLGERNLSLPAMHINKEYLDNNINKIISHEPEFLRGYPTAIFTLAKYMMRINHKMKLKAIFTTAEMLFDSQREVIENQFGCSVFDNYGCADGGGMANECTYHEGYHTAPEVSILEVLGESHENLDSGEQGHIVWTDLNNYATPFIRYAPGDLGSYAKERCRCGRNLPRLSTIIGRTTDIITFNNGRMLSGPALTLIFKEFNIVQYQLIKIKEDELRINLVPNKSFSDRESNKINEIMTYHCGENIKIKIEILEEIKVKPGSKFKFIINN